MGARQLAEQQGEPTPPETAKWLQQLRKGSTRLAILRILRDGDSYGYAIAAAVRDATHGALELAEGNLYPALHAIEAEGLVRSLWRDAGEGVPPRKYYHLTAAGRATLGNLAQAWETHASAMQALLEGGPR